MSTAATSPAVAERPAHVLVVDDESSVLHALRRVLVARGFEVTTLQQGLDALDVARRHDVDVAMLDIRMPGIDGLELLARFKRELPDVEVLMMTGYAAVESALQAIRGGAYDYLTKPFKSMEDAVRVVAKAAERRRLLVRNRYLEEALEGTSAGSLIASSAGMREVIRLLEAVAPADSSVLIQGESGVGKEVVAREIHRRSPRREGPWLAVNCSALSDNLLESELFGHVRGAFTGAVADKPGLFQLAEGGTLLLDEIGDVSAATQVKLLRALQEREVRPVGGTQVIPIDVRILCATNVDLQQAMRAGRFREDLYYRINVVGIQVPPLRERVDDIPVLAHHFLRRHAERAGRPALRLQAEAVEELCVRPWPGNVRELENAIERAVVLCAGDTVSADDLPQVQERADAAGGPSAGWLPSHFNAAFAESKRAVVQAFERRYAEWALRQAAGNVSEAARVAGLDRSNFRRLAQRYELRPDDYK